MVTWSWRHMRQRMAYDKRSVERSKWDSKQPINIMDSVWQQYLRSCWWFNIQSYQFEPLCNDESQQEREHSTSEDSDIDESSQAQDRLVNTDWWGFVYLLTILKKKHDWTKNWNNISQQVLTMISYPPPPPPPPQQFTKVLTNKHDCRSASYVPLF